MMKQLIEPRDIMKLRQLAGQQAKTQPVNLSLIGLRKMASHQTEDDPIAALERLALGEDEMKPRRKQTIAKAAPAVLAEPKATKIIEQLQSARNELETGGNTEGGAALSRAIAEVLTAAGLADAPLMDKALRSEYQRRAAIEPQAIIKQQYTNMLVLDDARRLVRRVR